MIKRHPILFTFIIFIVSLMTLSLVVSLFFGMTHSRLPSTPHVAVIKIEGPIFESEDTLRELNKYREEGNTRAIVIRIDSPGGAVAPAQEIFTELMKMREKKKIVVSMGKVAASGGYYVAAGAHQIFASPGSITGSIGVIMETLGFQNWLEAAQLESRVLKTGKYKDAGSPLRSMEDWEKDYLQGIIDGVYSQFLGDVARGRGLDLEAVKAVADGRIFTGSEAKDLGLVDRLGNLYDAIAVAKDLSGLSEDAGVVWPPEERFFGLDKILTQMKAWGLGNFTFQLPLTVMKY